MRPNHEPDVRIARIRLSDKSSRLRPRHVVPKPAQTYEPEVTHRSSTSTVLPPSRSFDLSVKIESKSSDSKLRQGLQSFRSMRRMEASFKKARPLQLRFSQSLARRRQRLSQAIVRSTIQRLGSCTKPLARSDRLMISVLR